MHSNLERLKEFSNKVNDIINKRQLKVNPKIIVVTKTFPLSKIVPLLESGHIHYGENKIQEAENKWLEAKKNYKDLQLHMIGNLQSNKAKKAIKLFDYIHSLDNEKLASKLSLYQKELGKKIKFFIQVNLENEKGKSGISLNLVSDFLNYCTEELFLNVVGLMCLPPLGSDTNKYFKLLKEKSIKLNLRELSMGMSSDFQNALSNGSTFLRIGTLIMGERNFT